MRVEKVSLCNFRNYSDTTINFKHSTLIIGSNDVGKTNLIYGMRLLLDKSLSDADIEPNETDFHISPIGIQANEFSITIYFCEVKEDAVLSVLKGHVSEHSSTIFRLVAQRSSLEYQLYIGATENSLELINSRYYLRYINLRYINAQRNLQKFIEKEKKTLLKISRCELNDEDSDKDQALVTEIGKNLNYVNERVRELNYVKNSTALVNKELKKIAHTLINYEVHLDTGAIQVQQFIDNLKLSASNNGSKMLLGGDGRNNQILLALWTAKSQRELNPEDEVVFYCIEEPEAHLHPHQQRKLADYLNNELIGQTIITTHSPQITARYSPDSIIHIINRNSDSYAASGGCSDCISNAWDNLGYRMSILPAEAFFSRVVLLVEGPSEKLFYTELAEALNIDLDFYNISILTVDGIQFKVYVDIL
ncbi:AAA family ATPase [Psychrobacter sp. Ps7]|uniref:ATP-dependent nuclease n=1 Tax=Psychrobacter sp. Ps7 TaxID=2790961 RepID=UPI001EDFB6C5|nr:AAA family ATPase [Psychrobacter sp. Ps7]MCG3873639.1 AAA family ATPase [Psychrobacter sp. Ps7]